MPLFQMWFPSLLPSMVTLPDLDFIPVSQWWFSNKILPLSDCAHVPFSSLWPSPIPLLLPVSLRWEFERLWISPHVNPHDRTDYPVMCAYGTMSHPFSYSLWLYNHCFVNYLTLRNRTDRQKIMCVNLWTDHLDFHTCFIYSIPISLSPPESVTSLCLFIDVKKGPILFRHEVVVRIRS